MYLTNVNILLSILNERHFPPMKLAPVSESLFQWKCRSQVEIDVAFVLHFINPNKAGLFKASFFYGGLNLTPPPPFIFQEELIQYQYNLIQLLNNLFN